MKVINRTKVIDYLKEYKDLFDWDDGGREKAVLTRALKEISEMPYRKEYNQDNAMKKALDKSRKYLEETKEYIKDLEQAKMERDLAVKQLKDLGYELGEKPRVGKWVLKKKLEPLAYDTDPLNWDNYDEDTHSEWKELYFCSECGWESGWFEGGNYCKNCGAKMEGNKCE